MVNALTYGHMISGGYAGPNKNRTAQAKMLQVSKLQTKPTILSHSRGANTMSRLSRMMDYRSNYNPLTNLMNRYPAQAKQSLIYRGLKGAAGKVAGAPRAALGSAFDFVAKRPRLLSTAKFTGAGIGLGGLVAGAALGISYGVAAMGRARSRAPVVHTGAIRSTGQTNQYFNLGQDPFAGVRFAGKRR